MKASDQFDFLASQFADVESGWSIGTFGAIAEFTRDADEQATLCQDRGIISVLTARGGLRITDRADLRLIASEAPTRESWSHRVALCLPRERCAMSRRTELTEIGADADALRTEDRDGVLFDLGLGAFQVDVCVRTADLQVVNALRARTGRSVFAAGNDAMGIILASNPHRVFVSHVGRAEVFQPIPPPDGKSPDGPHTHVLPKLLANGRTHPATELLPDGWIPCAHLYPPHPLRDQLGRKYPFRRDSHAAFQILLARYGDPDLAALKRHVTDSIRSGHEPLKVSVPNDRSARAIVRVALRQLSATETPSPALTAWRSAYDRFDPEETADPMDALH